MKNLFEYLFWRGDLSFSESPFNEIDGLLLSQISYINFKDAVPSDFAGKGVSMKEAADKIKNLKDFSTRSQFFSGINSKTMELFLSAAETKRFSEIRMKAFVDILDLQKEEQFSALTYTWKDFCAVIFRGTDGNIIGWKEDCQLGCMDEIPAQKEALDYLQKSATKTKGKIFIAGHSKGGNLSIYSAAKSCNKIKKRIISVFNYDGPGFDKSFFKSLEYLEVESKIYTYVPKLSIVGMLFCHPKKVKIVTSENKGAMQHDPLSWQIGPTYFPEVQSTAKESKFISSTVNSWIDNLSREQRTQFVEGVFGILKSANITENDQLKAKPLESVGKMISAFSKMDADTRHVLQNTAQLLMKSGWDNLLTTK